MNEKRFFEEMRTCSMKCTCSTGQGHLPWVSYNIGGDKTRIHADKFAHIISSNAIQNSCMKLYFY